MEINRMLLKSLVERLESQFKRLESQISTHPMPEAREMDSFLGRKIRQSEMLHSMIDSVQSDLAPPAVDLAVLRITFRQLKLELRFAERKWRRLLLNESRLRRLQEKDSGFSTVAA